MKKILAFVGVMLFASAVYAQTPVKTVATTKPAANSVLTFKESTKDIGKVEYNKPVTVEFAFTNTGKTPLVINDVQPSCGCTRGDFTKEPVAPGKSGIIKLIYSANHVGPVNKSATVTSNSATPSTTIFIKGEVIAAAEKPAGTPQK
ncbi:MAG: DUF1573 domain-containing protein [Verrucomicrobia bacterium]|nr:DUF1573 domain-containing protein [Cytophagales bacterium]